MPRAGFERETAEGDSQEAAVQPRRQTRIEESSAITQQRDSSHTRPNGRVLIPGSNGLNTDHVQRDKATELASSVSEPLASYIARSGFGLRRASGSPSLKPLQTKRVVRWSRLSGFSQSVVYPHFIFALGLRSVFVHARSEREPQDEWMKEWMTSALGSWCPKFVRYSFLPSGGRKDWIGPPKLHQASTCCSSLLAREVEAADSGDYSACILCLEVLREPCATETILNSGLYSSRTRGDTTVHDSPRH
ncbi:hypothetical protein FB45DRAFT_877614 [Roridomyces roridus]|uniref:Uncharacterized protein n=1 Tax=Roridomyces roridus TaxID=1738132 RepID=A0AAD7B254_9AGAR|nr:hypothetical protein FB45DRAFT_877614 [Roridomyces roridus]